MLDMIYHNRTQLLAFTLIGLLLSVVLAVIATFGVIFSNIRYIIFLPISFMYFASCFLGLMIVAEENREQQKLKNFFSIQAAAFLFASLLIPLALYFMYT